MKNHNQIILDLYFIEKLRVADIAVKLNISKSAVSQVLSKDTRYIAEKNKRKNENEQKHRENTKQYVTSERKRVQFTNAVDELFLKKQHEDASKQMSKGNYLTNENFRKWNQSAYKINPSKNRYEWDEKLTRSYALPKYIKER